MRIKFPIRIFDALFGDTNIVPHPDCSGCAAVGDAGIPTGIHLALHKKCWCFGATSMLTLVVFTMWQDMDGVRSTHRWHHNVGCQLAHQILLV